MIRLKADTTDVQRWPDPCSGSVRL